MNLDIYKNITVNEIKAIYAAALEEAETRKIPFEVAIAEATKAYANDKEKEKEDIIEGAREQAEAIRNFDQNQAQIKDIIQGAREQAETIRSFDQNHEQLNEDVNSFHPQTR